MNQLRYWTYGSNLNLVIPQLNSIFFTGQQWTEENKVGKLSDGPPDFEGNGIFSKLLLDVSPVFV